MNRKVLISKQKKRINGDILVIRLLDYSPKEMLNLKPKEIKEAIMLAGGRTLHVLSRLSAPNTVQYVCNPELVAIFGADIVGLAAYDPIDPLFPGLPSKNPKDDESTRNIQIQLGKGWTVREVRELIGRLVSIDMEVPSQYGKEEIDHRGRARSRYFTKENAQKVISQGPDIFGVGSREGSREDVYQSVIDAKKLVKGKCLLAVGLERPLGATIKGKKPYDLRKLITPEAVTNIAEAGADIIQVPAAGCLPGFDREYVQKLFAVIHKYNCLASAGIQQSQEGADVETIKRLALLNKMAGIDMLNLGDAGLNESTTLPENIMAVSIVIKGRRHTYRRMARSILR